MKYCTQCSEELIPRVPEGDERIRQVCSSCGFIHYENPKLVVGAIPFLNEKILLCRRAIEPRYGYWTLPAGYMENGEILEECAVRETREEANAEIKIIDLHALYSVPLVNQVHIFFTAEMVSENFSPGIESLDVKLFSEDEIPWDDISFETVRFALERFFHDRKNGSRPPHLSFPGKE